MVPDEGLPPTTPLTLHVTEAVSGELPTVTVNGNDCPVLIVADAGLM